MKKLAMIAMALLLPTLLTGCGVRVKEHWGFMGPSTYEATNGKISVTYYNGACCCVAEQVLENLADYANSGKLDWSKMADKDFADKVLEEECQRVKNGVPQKAHEMMRED